MSDIQQDTTTKPASETTTERCNRDEADYPKAYRCKDCPFKGKVIGSRGPVDSPFVIVGESPGSQELREGRPFVGPSGVVLQAALDQHKGYPDPYITNAFKCYPPKAKEGETKQVVAPTQACHDQLVEELQRAPRQVILALGNPASWSLTGNYNIRITRDRGKLFPSEFSEKGIVTSVHPAFLLRGNGSLRQFKADVDYALRLLLGGVPKGVPATRYTLINSVERLEQFIEAYIASPTKHITSDYETTGFSFISDRLICAGYTLDGVHSWIVPILDKPETLWYLKVIHSLPGAKFTWHNGKFDIKFAHFVGVEEARVDDDTMLMSYANDETRGVHDLETCGNDWLGSPNWKNELKKHIPKGGNYSHVPRPILYDYLAKDLYNTHALRSIFSKLLEYNPVSTLLYEKTLIPASAFLANVEKNGITVDLERVEENDKALEKPIKDYSEAFNKFAEPFGKVINLNSSLQLKEFLFEDLKIPTKIKSTNVDVLDKLDHPAVDVLKLYRKVQKARSTYVKPVYENMEPDGKIHSTYLIHGTATGRLSSRDPNLQNIPRDPTIRGQFIAAKGRIFIEPDLNQAELRSLACLSGDDELIRIYSTDGLSLHEEVRRDIYGTIDSWTEADIEKFLKQFYLETRYHEGQDRIEEEQKMRAKTVNFGIVYGRQAPDIAEEFKTSTQEAQRWINAWFKRFPKATKFIQACRSAPTQMKNLKTCFGHRKRFGVVTPETLNSIQNEAANFPHQSTASTMCIHAAMRLEEKFRRDYDAHFINLVHDSLLIDCPNDDNVIARVSYEAKAEMQQVPIDWGMKRVPFLAEAKMGYRWGGLTKEKQFWRMRNAGVFYRDLINVCIS